MSIENHLQELGISLPPVPKALASYIPAKRSGNLIFTSGQLPFKDGDVMQKGKVGNYINIEEAGRAARIACLNALAAVVSVTGNLESIVQIVKLGVYVASEPDFTDQHKVANYASELLMDIFGEKGKHSRFAVGVNTLPLGSSVELELIVEVK
ncbi:MAG: RidA family protein [Leptospiraceae bacterium]|nr:RidA family protein [Leptospiraceae bacterium]